MTRLGVVTGLASEARIVEEEARARGVGPPLTALSGADSERAERLTGDLIAKGAEILVSFGLAGGLAPSLGPGSLLLPRAVRLPGGDLIETSRDWVSALEAHLHDSGQVWQGGAILGSDNAVLSAAEKSARYQRFGAVAVDMESHVVAESARKAGLPFLVLRAVADPAWRPLPAWALAATRPDGTLRLASTITALCLRPWALPAAFRLGLDSRQALRTLSRAVRLGRLVELAL